MNTQPDSPSKKLDLDKESYAQLLLRKDKEIEELKEDRQMLLSKLIEKEKEIATLNDIMRRLKR